MPELAIVEVGNIERGRLGRDGKVRRSAEGPVAVVAQDAYLDGPHDMNSEVAVAVAVDIAGEDLGGVRARGMQDRRGKGSGAGVDQDGHLPGVRPTRDRKVEIAVGVEIGRGRIRRTVADRVADLGGERTAARTRQHTYRVVGRVHDRRVREGVPVEISDRGRLRVARQGGGLRGPQRDRHRVEDDLDAVAGLVCRDDVEGAARVEIGEGESCPEDGEVPGPASERAGAAVEVQGSGPGANDEVASLSASRSAKPMKKAFSRSVNVGPRVNTPWPLLRNR